VAPAALAGPTHHFVLFSNRSAFVMRACYTATDAQGRQLAQDCDQVAAAQKSTFWVPNAAAKTRVTVSDRGTQMFGRDQSNDRDLCIRASASGSVHEATDKPCNSN
jgi:hypothetical protein